MVIDLHLAALNIQPLVSTTDILGLPNI